MTAAPLNGIRILDLTNVLAGPFACHQLVHLGAEVIKVEAKGRGDLARNLGFSAELSAKNMGVSFLAQNAGKKSIEVNLKRDSGKDVLKRLVASADVLVENFRPGVMDRLGVGYDKLKQVNPRLIYCAISGFGQDGPWAARPAYDQIIQGVSGVMAITGDADSAPLRVGYPLADTVGGLTAAMAISAALNAPERGTFIDVSMLEAVLATMGWVVSNHLMCGTEQAPIGNENAAASPSGTFQCADGKLNIAANQQAQWEVLARHVGRADLLDRPEFATREDRKANRHSLRAELETALTKRPVAAWEDELNRIGVPAGAVMTVSQVIRHPQVAERDFVNRFENPPGVDQDIEQVRIAAMFDGTRPSVETPPPVLGQHTNELLTGLGYSEDEIAALQAEGTV